LFFKHQGAPDDKNNCDLAGANLIESIREHARWQSPCAMVEQDGVLLVSICTALVTNAGFANGASVVTLQASPFGEPVYQRLGYKTYDRLKWFRHSGNAG
jgi:hypothetical protein